MRVMQVDQATNVIIVFPRHPRDEARMRKVALHALNSGVTVVSVRFLSRTAFEIFAYHFFREVLRIRKKNEEVFFAPRLTWGWSLDAGVLRASKRLARNLVSRFPGVSHVIVGDSHQGSSLVVKLLIEETGAKLVLSPEGVGVFRARFGKYPWVPHSRFDAIFSVARSLSPFAPVFRQNPKKRGFSVLWRLQRLIDLTIFSGRPTLESLQISQVDILVSDWPTDLDIGIGWQTHLRETSQSSAVASTGPGEGGEPVGLIFVHQPVALSTDTWARALQKIPDPENPLILVKAHRDVRGLEEFIEAIQQRFTSGVVRLVSEGAAEDLIRSRQPEYLVGVTSTVLFNLALAKPSFPILSLAEALLSNLCPGEEQMIAALTGHQLAALKALGASLIQFPH
jgi:hypothetical protein